MSTIQVSQFQYSLTTSAILDNRDHFKTIDRITRYGISRKELRNYQASVRRLTIERVDLSSGAYQLKMEIGKGTKSLRVVE